VNRDLFFQIWEGKVDHTRGWADWDVSGSSSGYSEGKACEGGVPSREKAPKKKRGKKGYIIKTSAEGKAPAGRSYSSGKDLPLSMKRGQTAPKEQKEARTEWELYEIRTVYGNRRPILYPILERQSCSKRVACTESEGIEKKK